MAKRISAIEGPDGVTTYFNYADTTYGRAVSTIDGRANTTVREYWATQLYRVTDPLNHTTYFLWPQFMGQAGQELPFYGPIAITDATGASSYFRYDSYGNQVAATNPLGETSYYQYDSNRLTCAIDLWPRRRTMATMPTAKGPHRKTRWVPSATGNMIIRATSRHRLIPWWRASRLLLPPTSAISMVA